MRMNGLTLARRSALSAVLLGALVAVAPARAAAPAIDPDPGSPSLSELLAREDAARAKASLPLPPVVQAPTTPVHLPVTPGVPKGGVRQVYPPSNGGVTVLVPGARVR